MSSPLGQAGGSRRAARPRVALVTWAEGAVALTALRLAVFVEEQGVPLELELDGLDAACRHVVVWGDGGEALGTARLHPDGDRAKIGRMAVRKPWRGKGLGKAMLAALVEEARRQGVTRLTLSAQTAALDFYAKAGFEATGPVFDDAGIPHRLMELTLTPSAPNRSTGGGLATVLAAALALAVFATACTPWRADYLKAQVHKASEEEVAARLGPPAEVKVLDSGGSEWVYHVFSDSIFNYSYRGHEAEADCREYLLTFNERHVLTYWLAQECL